jgi:hypothetical protein
VAKYLSKKEKSLVNRYRSKLLIEDLDTYHKKILWQFKQENADFKFYNTTNEIMYDEDYLQALLTKKIRGQKVKIYYKTPEIKKQLLTEAKAWKKEQKNLKKEITE